MKIQVCTGCDIEKPITEFHKSKLRCKICRREDEKRYFYSKAERKCIECKEVLTIDNFYPLNYKCKSCYLTTQKEYRKTNHEQVKAIEQRSKKKNKEQRKIYNDAYRLSYSGFYRGLLNSCRASDKKYKRDGFNLNLEWLEKQRDKQNNKCIYTKLYLVWTTNNKRKASIDRINNSLSHTIENCHLCIYPINLMKCDML